MKYNYIILTALLLASCTENAQQPPNQLIAYNVLVDAEHDNYEIYTMNLDGSNKQNITNHPAVDWTYHASGDRIYFLSDRDTTTRVFFLYEMNASGEEIRKISPIRLRDSWLDTFQDKIVVSPHKSEDSTGFLILNMQGSVLSKVPVDLPYFSDPMFAPDGSKIVFRGATQKSKRDVGHIEEIFVINTDGSGLRQLSSYPETKKARNWYSYNAGPPRWSESLKAVTYQSSQDGKYSLFQIGLDGTNAGKLTDNEYDEGWHAWSPDGRWLAIEIFDSEQTQFNILLRDWSTGKQTILTDSSFTYQQAPVFVRSAD